MNSKVDKLVTYIKQRYLDYRNWAEREYGGPDYKKKYLSIGIAIGAGVGALFALFPILGAAPWWAPIFPFLGFIAAFDAWGAVRQRGKPLEGWIRAFVIMAIFMCAFFFLRFGIGDVE